MLISMMIIVTVSILPSSKVHKELQKFSTFKMAYQNSLDGSVSNS
jgi:hypothetical protein